MRKFFRLDTLSTCIDEEVKPATCAGFTFEGLFDFEMGVRISDVKIQEFDRILPACVLAESI